jgi:hypothetical protein
VFELPWVKERHSREEAAAKKQQQRDANTAAENELLDVARYRYENARSEKVNHEGEDLNTRWQEIDKFYRGRQWTDTTTANKSYPVLNYCFGLIESVVPRLTDSTPEVLVMPRRDPTNVPLAKMLGYGHEHIWYVNKMDAQLKSFIRMGMKYGTSILKTIWDPDAFDGMGEVTYKVVHPMNFYPDPRAYSVAEMDFCFMVVKKPLEFFLRRWPEKGKLVSPDDDATTDTERVQGSDRISTEQVATLKEYWFRDEEGHVCCMYFAGEIVLQVIGGELDADKKGEPVYRHNKFPFSRFCDYELDKHFWGVGEVELVMLLNRLINSFEAQIIDNTRLMANTEWVVNKLMSGLREEDAWMFDSKPGNVIFSHNGGVDKVPGMPVPAHIPRHIEFLVSAMEQILGIHDVAQGKRPVGVRAASGIIALQEAANIRIRQKAKSLEDALEDAAEQATHLMLEYYDEPRMVRVTGFKVPIALNVRQLLNKQLLRAGVAAGMVPLTPEQVNMGMVPSPEQTGMPQEEYMGKLHQDLKYPDFDVIVKVGPSVPYSQALLYEQSKEFYQLGIIDRQAVLDVTNFPGKEDILRRMGAPVGGGQPGAERVGERGFAQQVPQGMPSRGRGNLRRM